MVWYLDSYTLDPFGIICWKVISHQSNMIRHSQLHESDCVLVIPTCATSLSTKTTFSHLPRSKTKTGPILTKKTGHKQKLNKVWSQWRNSSNSRNRWYLVPYLRQMHDPNLLLHATSTLFHQKSTTWSNLKHHITSTILAPWRVLRESQVQSPVPWDLKRAWMSLLMVSSS